MTTASFPRALVFTLGEEGFWTNDPRDSGGPTWRGETLAAFRAFRRDPHATAAQLHAISPAETAAFYRTLWDRVRGDDLPAGVDLSTFDATVNTGSNAGVQLQRVVGIGGQAADGVIGTGTLAALAHADPVAIGLRLLAPVLRLYQDAVGLLPDGKLGPTTHATFAAHGAAVLVAALYQQHDTFYRSRPQFPVFGVGWLARAEARARAGLRLAVAPGAELQAPIS